MQAAIVGDKLNQEEWQVILILQAPFGRQIDTKRRIRKSGMPTCVFRVVVKLVVHVPAQDAVTKSCCTRGDTLEFIKTDVLAAKHTIDIRKS